MKSSKVQQAPPRPTPQRTCIACRQKRDKRRLTRIVRTPDGQVVVDPTGKQNGRGAYVCDQLACWDRILNQPGLLNQALKMQVSQVERAALAGYRPADNLHEAAETAKEIQPEELFKA